MKIKNPILAIILCGVLSILVAQAVIALVCHIFDFRRYVTLEEDVSSGNLHIQEVKNKYRLRP